MTWAFCLVDAAGRVVMHQGGWITCKELGLEEVENNAAETIAATIMLEALPEGWEGDCYCDNRNAILRLTVGGSFTKVPEAWRQRAYAARHRLGKLDWHLLGGHPTKRELEVGYRRDGKRVSHFNVLCDEMCKELAAHCR